MKSEQEKRMEVGRRAGWELLTGRGLGRVAVCMLGLVMIGVTSGELAANERRFAFTYDTRTMAKGAWEYEQWLTWKHSSGKDRLDIRHEIEYGVTDRFQLAVYVADWRWEKRDGVKSRTTYQTSGVEAIYNLTDPIEDLLGSALYGEVKLGPEKFVLEGKLLLEKDIGPWVVGYNFVVEAEWEHEHYRDRKGVVKNTLGISYQISPRFLVGVEALHEFEYDDWDVRSSDAVYVGPNLSFRRRSWWVTVAALVQATDVDGEPDAQVRMLVGVDF